METILNATSLVFGLFTNAYHGILDYCNRPKATGAAWGNERLIGSIFNKGLLYSRNRKTTMKAAYENMYICGPTGSGKTANILIKLLLSLPKNSTIIINDPSGELKEKLSGFFARNKKVLFLNFTDPRSSAGFNFLNYIHKPSDVQRIASMLVANTLEKGHGGDQFWALESKLMLGIIIRTVLYQPEEFHNMANCLQALKILMAHPNTFDVFVATSGDKDLIMSYKSCLSMPEKTFLNVCASVQSCLQIFEDEDIATVCSGNGINLESIRKEPTVIFLNNSLKDMRYTKILSELFFEQLYGFLLDRMPKQNDLNVFCILEEASSIMVPVLPVAIANTRKMRVSNVVCSQNTQYLRVMYKEEAENIITQCGTKIYLPGQTEIPTLKDLELLSGISQVEEKDGSKRNIPLIRASEVRILPNKRSIVMQTNKSLVKGRTAPYYKSLKYRYLTSFKPVDSNSPKLTKPKLLMAIEMNEYESAQQKHSTTAVHE